MEKVRWSDEKVVKLIEQYEMKPLLWDKTNRFYKNRQKRAAAWQDIGKNMNVGALELEWKMKVILAQYRRERAKMLKAKKLGTSVDDIHWSRWFGFKHLIFLYNSNNPGEISQKSVKPENADVFINESNDLQGDKNETDFAFVNIPSGTYDTEKTNGISKKSIVPRKRITVKKRLIRNSDYNVLGACKVQSVRNSRMIRREEERDEYTAFGEFITYKLRKLSPYARAVVQHKINTVLFEAELGECDKPSDVKSVAQAKLKHG